MPKKTATARSGAQRNKPKVQKNFELVRQVADKPTLEETSSDESTEAATTVDVDTVEVPETSSESKSRESSTTSIRKRNASARSATPEIPDERASTSKATDMTSKGSSQVQPETQSESTSTDNGTTTAPKGSAAGRLAARRHAVQRSQHRAAATLITAEHYSYVRKDLAFIAILASIMFIVIIVLHFVPGIGS